MYRIFAPLDADEPLPRELLQEGRRYRTVGRREAAGMLWIPAVLLLLYFLGWVHANVMFALALPVLLFTSLWLFARSARR